MITKVIKISNVNKFVNENGEPIKYYSPKENNKFICKIDNKEVEILHDQINIGFGGYVNFIYNDIKYIIDDGFRDNLIKAGYIIYKDYDIERIDNKDEGLNLRNNILNDIMEKLKNNLKSSDSSSAFALQQDASDILLIFETSNYTYTIKFDSVNRIVQKNQIRKENGIPFYPFEKDMDKYGTIYLSIFCKKKINANEESNHKLQLANAFINKLSNVLGEEYKYKDLIIKKKIINQEEI